LTENLVSGLASVLAFGIAAQWVAWRLKLPSILFLLTFGFIAGPVTGFLNPNELFGDLLFPIVSISVAVILFEGGLTLRISELREIAKIVRNLTTIGVLVTWVSVAALAHFLLNLNLTLSLLLGAILVVTGPTVIGPLLRHIRPVGRVGNIIKWEGILNDPIGALPGRIGFRSGSGGRGPGSQRRRLTQHPQDSFLRRSRRVYQCFPSGILAEAILDSGFSPGSGNARNGDRHFRLL
jgi:Kef-type K+ transport system membrane component KefB